MNEVDERGWAHIHQAASNGYSKSVDKFIKAADDQLEFETQDALKETPLLVSVRAGKPNLETIKIIVEFGGNLAAINSLNHGIVEICCLEDHTDLLEYFIRMDREELPVWTKIMKFFSSDMEDEAASAGRSLCKLTKPDGNIPNPSWKHVYDIGGVVKLVNVLKSDIGDLAKIEALNCLINLMKVREVIDQMAKADAIESLIHHLGSQNSSVIRQTTKAIGEFCRISQYAEQSSQKGVLPALIKVLKSSTEPSVLIEAANALGIVCEGSDTRQTLFSNTTGAIESICNIMQVATDPKLMLAACESISKICRRHSGNQNGFIDEGLVQNVIILVNINVKDIQLAAVDTIHMLVEGNCYTQKSVTDEGAIGPLINLLNRGKNPATQEKTAGALWSLAGDDGEDRRKMAATMGVDLLIDFLSSLSESLHYIGSEGLGVLAQGAKNEQDAIAKANGVQPLVRLLKCDKEYLVLSAIRSLRHLCLGVGYIPHSINQATISKSRGIKLLIALMTLSKSELIQVEAALTLACAALGNKHNMDEITNSSHHLEFSYVRILKLLYSSDVIVRLMAGAAIATFAYNNMMQQQAIAMEGGVRFTCFDDFLRSDDEYLRCNAAFQIVVLSRIIPDEEQAVSSAAGIKLIVDIMNESQSPVIQALACDCVARLAHTRAGIPSAFVAIQTVDRLCDLIESPFGQVRGCSAVALAYLSYNHTAERQLLNRCRLDTYIVKCLKHYLGKHKLSPRFIEEWKHYKSLRNLPPISDARPSLMSRVGHRAPTHRRKSIGVSHSKEHALPAISPRQDTFMGDLDAAQSKSRASLSRVSFHTDITPSRSASQSQSVAI